MNFPDIATPFHHSGMPAFVHLPGCNLLRDPVRYLLDIGPNNICQDDCQAPKRKGSKCHKEHFLITSEFGEVQLGWRYWQGTVMLAEAGAVTLPHLDKWGFGTWISCLEGEIRLAWLSKPGNKQLETLLKREDAVEGRWWFKV